MDHGTDLSVALTSLKLSLDCSCIVISICFTGTYHHEAEPVVISDLCRDTLAVIFTTS